MDPLTGFYACCYCCAPSYDIERIYAYTGTCAEPNRHTVPCVMCGQKVHDTPTSETPRRLVTGGTLGPESLT